MPFSALRLTLPTLMAVMLMISPVVPKIVRAEEKIHAWFDATLIQLTASRRVVSADMQKYAGAKKSSSALENQKILMTHARR